MVAETDIPLSKGGKGKPVDNVAEDLGDPATWDTERDAFKKEYATPWSPTREPMTAEARRTVNLIRYAWAIGIITGTIFGVVVGWWFL